MAKISAGTRRELVQALSERYRSAAKTEKRRILEEFVALTRYHRKHAIMSSAKKIEGTFAHSDHSL
jgi:hypothetical protein